MNLESTDTNSVSPSLALLQVHALKLVSDINEGFNLESSIDNLCGSLERVKAEQAIIENRPSGLEEELKRMSFEEYNDKVEGITACD